MTGPESVRIDQEIYNTSKRQKTNTTENRVRTKIVENKISLNFFFITQQYLLESSR